MGEDDEMDEECLDWWSKYFASVDTMIKVSFAVRMEQIYIVRTLEGIRHDTF